MYRIRSGPDFKGQLSPRNSGLVLLDFQPEFVGKNGSTAVQNALQLYQAAKKLNLPTVVTTLLGSSRSGTLLPELAEHVTEADLIQRRSINAWSMEHICNRIEAPSVTKVVLAGAMVDVSLTQTALNCLRENYDVYVAWDACIASNPQALEITFTRLVQAGIIPTTTQAIIAELTEQVPSWSTA